MIRAPINPPATRDVVTWHLSPAYLQHLVKVEAERRGLQAFAVTMSADGSITAHCTSGES